MASRRTFADWSRDHTAGLFRRALLLTGDWHRAEDLVQETLAKLYAHWHRIDLDQNAAGYAMRTLFHAYVSERRRRPSEVTLVDVVPDRPAPARDHDLRLDLIKALDALSPQERFVLVARYLDDLSVAEVAGMIDRPQSWVRNVAYRATKRIQRSPGPFAGLIN